MMSNSDKESASTKRRTCLDNEQRSASADKNGNSGRASDGQLVHSVSIVVDPAMDESVMTSTSEAVSGQPGNTELYTTTADSKGRRSPIIILENIDFEPTEKSNEDEDHIVQSIINIHANARLRKEEFARLLEEHAQLVNEINRVETSLM
jgi:hypothetical protein